MSLNEAVGLGPLATLRESRLSPGIDDVSYMYLVGWVPVPSDLLKLVPYLLSPWRDVKQGPPSGLAKLTA